MNVVIYTMNSKTTLLFSAPSIVALVLLFASGAVVEKHQLLAFGWYGGPWGDGWGGNYEGWHHYVR
jgi:hypothetical protein